MFFRIIFLASIPLLFAYKLESGKEFDVARYSNQGEKGERGYIGHHQNEKGEKGHHDKENHRKDYAEKAGNRHGYDHKDGYYAGHNQGHKGSKGYHYEDHGKYAKGHSTKGRHNIHKLDEFKKNKDFFDEDNDQAFEEKHGGYELSRGVVRGGHQKGGHFKKGYQDGKYGLLSFVDKGQHYFDDKGHNKAQGQEEFFGNQAEFGEKGGQDGFKQFGFSNSKKE